MCIFPDDDSKESKQKLTNCPTEGHIFMDKLTIKKWDEPINENQMDALCEVYDLLVKLKSNSGVDVFFPTDSNDEMPFMLSIIKKEVDILIKKYIETNENNDNKERVNYYLNSEVQS